MKEYIGVLEEEWVVTEKEEKSRYGGMRKPKTEI